MTTTVTARVNRRLGLSAERVYDAWLDPERARRFLFATPSGEMVRCDIDARPGGRYVITERRDGEDVEHTGEFLELVRPARIVFTLKVPKYSQDSDRVTLDIKPLGNACEVTITHEMSAENADYIPKVEEGWSGILDGLMAK